MPVPRPGGIGGLAGGWHEGGSGDQGPGDGELDAGGQELGDAAGGGGGGGGEEGGEGEIGEPERGRSAIPDAVGAAVTGDSSLMLNAFPPIEGLTRQAFRHSGPTTTQTEDSPLA
jgi:hypothetical protein